MKNYLKSIDSLVGKRVRVYRNLTDKCFSIKCLKTNRVVAHVMSVNLIDVTFPVSKKLRLRVLETGHKNVHAFVEGVIIPLKVESDLTPISYNPRKKDHFYYRKNGREIKKANYIHMDIQEGLYIA